VSQNTTEETVSRGDTGEHREVRRDDHGDDKGRILEDNHRDAREDARRDAREDAPRDTRKNNPRDARQDTRRDARVNSPRDTREDTRRDAREDALTDTQTRGSVEATVEDPKAVHGDLGVQEMCVEDIGEQTTLKHKTLPKHSYICTPSGPHLCCLTCKIPEQRTICAVVYEDCKEIKNKKLIYISSLIPQRPVLTQPCFVYAIQPTPPTEEAITPPGPPAVAATQGEKTAGTTERTAAPTNLLKNTERRRDGGLRNQGKMRPTRVFLDSGCLTGSYIKEELARKLASTCSSYFIPHVTKVCGAFGGL
jgi:hypothetical protein